MSLSGMLALISDPFTTSQPHYPIFKSIIPFRVLYICLMQAFVIVPIYFFRLTASMTWVIYRWSDDHVRVVLVLGPICGYMQDPWISLRNLWIPSSCRNAWIAQKSVDRAGYDLCTDITLISLLLINIARQVAVCVW